MDNRDRPPSRPPANSGRYGAQPRTSGTPKPAPADTRVRKKKKSKSQFAIFYITTVFVGAVAVLVILTVVLSSILNSNNSPNDVIAADTDSPLPSSQPTVTPNYGDEDVVSTIALVKAISLDSKKLLLYDLETDSTYNVYVDKTTSLKDKYGLAMVFAEFRPGEIVDVSFNKSDTMLISVQVSPQAWQVSQATNLKFDFEAKTVRFNNKDYKYDDRLVSTYAGADYSPVGIDPIDEVELKGYKDNVWYVNVLKSHATLEIENRPDIVDGSVEIDTSRVVELSQAGAVKVSEGAHRLIIKGSNIEPYALDINVHAGEIKSITLEEVKIKAGTMKFIISESDARVYIDGVLQTEIEAVQKPFGTYAIKVEKDGFATWENTITFNTASYDVNVTLQKIVSTCTMNFKTTPAGAQIYIDGIYIGLTPISASVEYGEHNIVINLDGYNQTVFPLTVSQASYDVDIPLQPLSDDTIPDTPANPIYEP